MITIMCCVLSSDLSFDSGQHRTDTFWSRGLGAFDSSISRVVER